MDSSHPTTKFTEKRFVTDKLVKPLCHLALPKIVRISFTDQDATDTSSDDEEQQQRVTRRVINEVRIEESEAVRVLLAKNQQQKPINSLPEEKKFRGVRQRPWGKWAAEIRDPLLKSKRRWLGTFNTAKEAALRYDREAIELRGPNARTNIIPPPKFPVSDHRSSSNESISINLSSSNLCSSNMSTSMDQIVVIDEYDSGKECQSNIRSPTSVLSSSGNEWRPVSKEKDESHFVGYFDGVINPEAILFGISEPILWEEMNMVPETLLREDLSDISLDSVGDFRSCKWNAEDFFQDQCGGF
ncbi:hypothetical protein ACLB2K_069416 [Fragaria x ananassa]